jgi:hypothetical protein
MQTAYAPAPTPERLKLDAADRALAPLVRDWFEHDLRDRIDAAMDRQLAIYLAGGQSRQRDFARAA